MNGLLQRSAVTVDNSSVATPGSKTNYLAAALLDHVLGRATFTRPPVLYLALSLAAFTTEVTGDNFEEITGGGYDRLAIANGSTAWTSLGMAIRCNATKLTLPTPTDDWGTARSYYLLDAATAGNAFYGANLIEPVFIPTGRPPYIAPGALTLTEF